MHVKMGISTIKEGGQEKEIHTLYASCTPLAFIGLKNIFD